MGLEIASCIAAIGIFSIRSGFCLKFADIHIAAESVERNLAAAVAMDAGIPLDYNIKIRGETAGQGIPVQRKSAVRRKAEIQFSGEGIHL